METVLESLITWWPFWLGLAILVALILLMQILGASGKSALSCPRSARNQKRVEILQITFKSSSGRFSNICYG